MSLDGRLPGAIRRAVSAGVLRRRHELPFVGRILVNEGDHVEVGQIWARGRLRSGVSIVDLPRFLRVELSESRRLLAVKVGATVPEGTLLAGNPGRMRTGRQWLAPTRGAVTELSPRTGVAVFVRSLREVALYCRLAGQVIAADPSDGIVVEGHGVSIAGAVGAGGRAFGPLRIIESGERPELSDEESTGAVLVTPDPLRPEWVRRAVEVRAAGIVAPTADDDSLSELGLAPSIAGMSTADEALHGPPLPVLLSEGVGYRRMPRAVQTILRASVGLAVAIVGSRQPGASEILLPPGPPEEAVAALRREAWPVRIVAGPEAGVDGSLVGPAMGTTRAPSGSPAPCVMVRRTEGGTVAVPAANVEALA